MTTKYATDSVSSGMRRGRSTFSVVGTTARCTTDESAASRPRSERIVGAIPRTTLRSSRRAVFASSWASAISALTAAGSVSNLVWARPIVIASDTSRGCTLSCMSRSMRCRSVCADDTAPNLASASAFTSCCSIAAGEGESNQRSILASTMGANTMIAAATANATTARGHASDGGKDSPAASSLRLTAIAAAGASIPNASRTNAIPPTARS